MKYFICFFILISVVIYFWPDSDPGKKIRELSEPPEIYFNPEEQYDLDEDKSLVSIRLRKASTVFQVPGNSLVGIYHPYKPWAEEIWDSFSYWVIWPSFEGRSQSNIHEFKENRSREIIKIHVSTFGLELVSNDFFHESHKKMSMEKVKSPEQPIDNLIRLVSASNNDSEYPSYFYQAHQDYITFPSGLPLQITCSVRSFWDTEKRSRPCSVEFVLPIQSWPDQHKYPLGGHSQCNYGIKVRYTFHEKLISSWEVVFDKVLRDVVGKIGEPEIAYNKQLQRINFGCAQIAR